MEQSTTFVSSTTPNHVCKLNKALYSLKQSPHAWYNKLSSCLLQYGFFSSKSETSLFVLPFGSSTTILLVYVNDNIVMGNDSQFLNSLICRLNQHFTLKDLGVLPFFFGNSSDFYYFYTTFMSTEAYL